MARIADIAAAFVVLFVPPFAAVSAVASAPIVFAEFVLAMA